MQKPCARAVVGAVPEPGCCCFGGTPYWPTVSTVFDKLRAGELLLSEDVLVKLHTTSWFELRLPAEPATGFVASSAAFELKKFSVPPAFRLYDVVPGDCAGQTVKPGWVEPASLGTLTAPNVSICCMVTLAAPAASCALEKA